MPLVDKQHESIAHNLEVKLLFAGERCRAVLSPLFSGAVDSE